MSVTEIPVVFPCASEHLVGIIHRPPKPKGHGVLAIVAGGPQYRGGCCRQLVHIARTFSTAGYPVMRFDYRGLGDGSGSYQGFLHIGPDIQAAVETFCKHVPEMEGVVLWGGCDAASACLIHGPALPRVRGMILGNPFVHTEASHAKVVVRHYYLTRLREGAFWRKLLGLRLNPFKAAATLVKNVIATRIGSTVAQGEKYRSDIPFPELMRRGAETFDGRTLMFMSGLSLVSKEFDELVNSSRPWQAALSKLKPTRVDIPDADQAFSTAGARDEIERRSLEWIKEL